jgi:hypothetical protein
MSAEHSRALSELRAFREGVIEFQKHVNGFPSDARAPMSPGVMAPPATHSREAFKDALDTLLSAIGIYEVLLQNNGGR